jgi:hypothetical protein
MREALGGRGGMGSFNKPVGDWNVSKASNISFMFSNALNFNKPILGIGTYPR